MLSFTAGLATGAGHGGLGDHVASEDHGDCSLRPSAHMMNMRMVVSAMVTCAGSEVREVSQTRPCEPKLMPLSAAWRIVERATAVYTANKPVRETRIAAKTRVNSAPASHSCAEGRNGMK